MHGLAQWEIKNPAEALALMKSFGADIDIRDEQGLTTLLRAARFGTGRDVMQALIEAGSDPLAVDKRGNSLLHCVAMNTKPGNVERLSIALKASPNIDASNQKGQTALVIARKYGNDSVTRGLVKAGAGKAQDNSE